MFSPLPRLRRFAKGRPGLRWLALAVLCLGLLGWWVVASGPRITISRETTYLTGPLDAEGFVDYVRALNELNAKRVTVEENAVPLLCEAWGRPSGIPEFNQKFFALLGTSAPPADRYLIVEADQRVREVRDENSPYYIGFSAFLEREGYLFEELLRKAGLLDEPPYIGEISEREVWNKVHSAAIRKPWASAEHPAVAAWLNANARPLELLLQASTKPKMFAPMASEGSLLSQLLPLNQAIKEMSLALAARASLEIGERNWQAAARDLAALHRLARLNALGNMQVEMLQALALDCLASVLEREFALACDADARRELREQLERLPAFPALADTIDLGERVQSVSLVCDAARLGVTRFEMLAAVSGQIPKVPASLVDWDYALREVNRWYDRAAAAQRLSNRAERRRAVRDVANDVADLEDKAYEGRPWARWLQPRRELSERVAQQWIFMGNLGDSLVAAVDTTDAERELTRITFALANFREDHGRFPERLEDLVPRYLAELPLDPFSEQAFRYRAEAAGQGFLLYSVGWNEQGDAGREREGGSTEDDLVVRYPADLEAPATGGE